jgi:hypothetical protein
VPFRQHHDRGPPVVYTVVDVAACQRGSADEGVADLPPVPPAQLVVLVLLPVLVGKRQDARLVGLEVRLRRVGKDLSALHFNVLESLDVHAEDARSLFPA